MFGGAVLAFTDKRSDRSWELCWKVETLKSAADIATMSVST
jgi:hypothetical protein